MLTTEAEVSIETRARELWAARELRYPATCRMPWDEAPQLTRQLMVAAARVELMSKRSPVGPNPEG